MVKSMKRPSRREWAIAFLRWDRRFLPGFSGRGDRWLLPGKDLKHSFLVDLDTNNYKHD